ncbi:protein regulator of cytokinesis 1 [Anabrus simplex]|uniref:protein regulator of cytokinesis 1 n=1 Tax=Anabrus simplex TaxID=316456 RepID=UPI0035A3B4EF
MALEGEILNDGFEHIRAAEKSLRHVTDENKFPKYWKILMGRIAKFPLECEILDTREEVEKMWTKCLKNKDDLHILKETWSTDYTEDVLQKHKTELAELNKFYTNNRELIDLLNKYESLWQCLANVEKQSHDPERLFKNRGAQLLKEEHDRRLSSKLPHFEKIILQLLEKRRKEGREEFLVHGELFADLVKRRWQEHKENISSRKRSQEEVQKPLSVGPEAKRRHLMEVQPQPHKVQSVGRDSKLRHLQEKHRPVSVLKGPECKVSRSLKMV